MVPVIRNISSLVVVAGISLGAGVCLAQPTAPASNHDAKPASGASAGAANAQPSPLGKGEAIFMLDYEVIPVPGNASIDLMGFHVLNKMNDWLYLGVGGYAPLFRGEYGGFMAFDVTAHVQRKLFGNVFANAGVSLGGGGGGKSEEQSKVLSGTGGFVKSYVGLGYDFKDFSLGANIAKMKFTKSAIDHSQLNLFVQVPFSYDIGPYSGSGQTLFRADKVDSRGSLEDASENIMSLGLDNYKQIDPEGSNKETINLADLQFSHFMTKNSYWYINVAVGYRGLPLYNAILGGVGYRLRVSPNINLYGQLAVGSGGYAPDTIDTGPGLLVHPKVSAEYMFDKNFGLSLSAGYLAAPKGSSKNYTVGAALNYHLHAGEGGYGANGAGAKSFLRGYRVNLFQQTEFNLKFKGIERSNVNLLTLQVDNIVNDHFYVPVQVGVAYNDYLGYPGYGELLAGVGVQNKYTEGNRFQFFGQLLVGTNVHGPVLKTGVGMNVGLSDRLALYGVAGQTLGPAKDKKFRSDYLGLGLSYRFSVPGG